MKLDMELKLSKKIQSAATPQLMSHIEVETSKVILTESILTTIMDVISLIGTMNIDEKILLEFGCYLYRITPAILELQISSTSPPNAIEILKSLTNNVDHANELIKKYNNEEKLIPNVKEISEVTGKMGHDLSLIPPSTFGNEQYAELAIQSLSEEMKNANFNDLVEIKKDNSIIPYIAEESQKYSSNDVNDMPHLKDFLKGMYYGPHGDSSYTSKIYSQMSENIEPLYDTFFCPLTKKIMHDPVTIESGITYERRAITEYFNKVKDDSKDILCPATGMRIKGRALNTNIALKMTIAEWKERNEMTRIKAAHTALTLARSDAMALDAIKDLKLLCKTESPNKMKIHNFGITDMLTGFLEDRDRKLRCETLDILRILAEDDKGKEIIAETKAIPAAIKMLSSNHVSVRHASVSFLLELSKSRILCENIGSVTGGILMLITMKCNESSDPIVPEKAGEILKNLESCSKNIKSMAENGHLDPLLNHLINGSEGTQSEMVGYLSELVIANNMKTYVAEMTSTPLIRMISKEDNPNRTEAFKALVGISTHHSNNKILIKAGVIPVIINELFAQNKPKNSKEESASILANILESGLDPKTIRVGKIGQSITSDTIIYEITRMIQPSSADELNINLIRVLLSLMKSENPFSTILSLIKQAETCFTIIKFLNSTNDELVTNSAELLIRVSPHMGYAVAERLCKTRGQPEGVIDHFHTAHGTAKKHAMIANLLAKLPHQNLALNQQLLETMPSVIQKVNEIQRGGARTSRYTRAYLEGLVGILVRFTATLHDSDILQMAREQNLVSVFTELLIKTVGSCEVQRLCAVGLERLSSQSINLSRSITERKKPNKKRVFLLRCFSLMASKDMKVRLCPVHREECAKCTNFCLLEAHAVEKLLGCLEHENDDVVEAALSAISTLLDESVDVVGAAEVLKEMNVVQRVVTLLRDRRSNTIWKKSLWVIERFLVGGGEKSSSVISSDKEFSFALVNALHQGDSSTKKIAENILRKLNAVPHDYSSSLII